MSVSQALAQLEEQRITLRPLTKVIIGIKSSFYINRELICDGSSPSSPTIILLSGNSQIGKGSSVYLLFAYLIKKIVKKENEKNGNRNLKTI